MKRLHLLAIGVLMRRLLLVLFPAGLLLSQNAEISWTIESDEIEVDPTTGVLYTKTGARIQYKKGTPEAAELTFDQGTFSGTTGDVNATGNVTLRHKDAELTSNKALIKIKSGVVNAAGNVTLRHRGTKLTLDHASFNLKSGDVNATGSVTLRHKEIEMTSDHASFNFKSGDGNAIGNVILKRGGKTWRSERMAYNFITKVFTAPREDDSKTSAEKQRSTEENQPNKSISQNALILIIGVVLLFLFGCGLYKLSSKKVD